MLGRLNNAAPLPARGQAASPRTCEYITVRGKRNFADQTKDREMGRLSGDPSGHCKRRQKGAEEMCTVGSRDERDRDLKHFHDQPGGWREGTTTQRIQWPPGAEKGPEIRS